MNEEMIRHFYEMAKNNDFETFKRLFESFSKDNSGECFRCANKVKTTVIGFYHECERCGVKY